MRWDYSALATHYDKRADYAVEAVRRLLALARPDPARPIADVGAGTGKLTRLLLHERYPVHAIEPNDAMRSIGIRNTAGAAVTWRVGTGEDTGLPLASYDLVTFGSSFNVTDRTRTLVEVGRILRPRGWFACLWNHRDLDDEVQRTCERIILEAIPGYAYGSRRADQTDVIRASGLFEGPEIIEATTVQVMSVADFVEAWRSHATLERQAGDRFGDIVDAIAHALSARTELAVPYTTRVWAARLRA